MGETLSYGCIVNAGVSLYETLKKDQRLGDVPQGLATLVLPGEEFSKGYVFRAPEFSTAMDYVVRDDLSISAEN